MFGHRDTVTVRRRPSGTILDPKIKNALERSVNERGVRPTARAVGIAPTGLSKILKSGHRVYTPTLQKLKVWFISNDAKPFISGSADRRAMALEVLVETLDDNAEARIRAIVQGA